MDPFIILYGTAFWMLAIITFVLLVAAVEYDNGWGASIITAAVIIGLWFGVEINLFAWVWANPATALTYSVMYFAAGTTWAISKWWFYCRKLLDIVRDVKMSFLNHHNITNNVIPADKRNKFEKEVIQTHGYHDRHYPPQAMDHKSDWLMWATWWPVSFFWTMLNQPIKNAWLFIYSHLGGLMQKISNMVFKDI